MKSKRFKELPINTSTLPAESIEKLLPKVKKNWFGWIPQHARPPEVDL